MAHLRDADELIVADGGSTDGTPAVAEAAGGRLISCQTGRGIQLRAGAEAARGDWLLFVHADTLIDHSWRDAAQAHMEDDPASAACFRFRLNDGSWQARLVEHAVAARVRLLGLPYGDQGLLISRALYEQLGGYKPLPLMEDVDLVRRIGRGRIRALNVDAITSAERWRKDGWIRRSALNLACLALYRAGMPPELVARLHS